MLFCSDTNKQLYPCGNLRSRAQKWLSPASLEKGIKHRKIPFSLVLCMPGGSKCLHGWLQIMAVANFEQLLSFLIEAELSHFSPKSTKLHM